MQLTKTLEAMTCAAVIGTTCATTFADGLDPSIMIATQPLPQIMYQVDPVVHKGRMYVVGGWDIGSGALDTVYMSQIDMDGSLSPWQALELLPEAAQAPGVTVARNRLFVATLSGSMYSAAILPDGTIAPWQAELAAAPFAGGRMTIEAYGGHLYVLGGWTGSSMLDDVYMAPINLDGSLGAWTQLGDMPEPRQHSSVHFFNDRVYVAGGITCNSGDGCILDTAWSAPVNADGTLGAWRPEPALPHPLWYHTSVLVNGEIFLLGGRIEYGGNNSLTAIYRGRIDPIDGTIDAWESCDCLDTSFTIGMGAVYAPDAGGSLYLVGGNQPGVGSTGLVLRNVFSPNVDGACNGVGTSDLLLLLGAWGVCP